MPENCNLETNEVKPSCKLYINEHMDEINRSINSGFQAMGDRLLALEISNNAQSIDIGSVKSSVDALTHGNGVKGHRQIVREFEEHIKLHNKREERTFQVFLKYSGVFLLILFNLTLIYKAYTTNDLVQKVITEQIVQKDAK